MSYLLLLPWLNKEASSCCWDSRSYFVRLIRRSDHSANKRAYSSCMFLAKWTKQSRKQKVKFLNLGGEFEERGSVYGAESWKTVFPFSCQSSIDLFRHFCSRMHRLATISYTFGWKVRRQWYYANSQSHRVPVRSANGAFTLASKSTKSRRQLFVDFDASVTRLKKTPSMIASPIDAFSVFDSPKHRYRPI